MQQETSQPEPVFNEQKVIESMKAIDSAIMNRPIEDIQEIQRRLTALLTLRIECRKLEDEIDRTVGYK